MSCTLWCCGLTLTEGTASFYITCRAYENKSESTQALCVLVILCCSTHLLCPYVVETLGPQSRHARADVSTVCCRMCTVVPCRWFSEDLRDSFCLFLGSAPKRNSVFSYGLSHAYLCDSLETIQLLGQAFCAMYSVKCCKQSFSRRL